MVHGGGRHRAPGCSLATRSPGESASMLAAPRKTPGLCRSTGAARLRPVGSSPLTQGRRQARRWQGDARPDGDIPSFRGTQVLTAVPLPASLTAAVTAEWARQPRPHPREHLARPGPVELAETRAFLGSAASAQTLANSPSSSGSRCRAPAGRRFGWPGRRSDGRTCRRSCLSRDDQVAFPEGAPGEELDGVDAHMSVSTTGTTPRPRRAARSPAGRSGQP